MTPSTWKAVERRLTAPYGARRIALSGGNNTQGNTRSDSDHKALFIEIKHGRRWLGLGRLWDNVRALAKAEGKAPVLIINPLRSRAPLACITVDRHAALEAIAAAAHAHLRAGACDPATAKELGDAVVRLNAGRGVDT